MYIGSMLMIFRKKRLVVELILTLLFFSLSIYYIYKKDLRSEVRLTILAKITQPDNWKIYINKEKPLVKAVNPTADFITVYFHLPHTKINNIRFAPGWDKSTVTIKYMKLTGLFNNHIWDSAALKTIFDKRRGIKRAFVKDGCFYIKTMGNEGFLRFGKGARQTINKISGNKIIFYFTAIILALLFFYLVHFFNPRGLALFLKPGFLTGMSLLFFIVIFLPLADGILHISRHFKLYALQEKRQQAEKPIFRFSTLLNYLPSYRNYYDDHFKFRALLIYGNNLIKVNVFKVSPTPRVLLGKEGWLFLARESEWVNEVDYYRRVKPFTPAELEQWRRVLTQRRDWLRARGIHYLFITIPNKSTIYPEFMPDYLRPVNQPPRLDQLIAYMKQKEDFPILDLRPTFFAAKKERRLYRKTDTHWNDNGIYFAYRAIVKYFSRFFQDLEAMPLSRFKIVERESHGGDLAIMLALQRKQFREIKILYLHRQPSRVSFAGSERISNNFIKYIQKCSVCKLPPVLMVHDSFGEGLKPYISEHFSRVIYIHDWDLNFYPGIIKKEGVKIVIDEMAERFLLEPPPINPAL
jgi:hypothetical protein